MVALRAAQDMTALEEFAIPGNLLFWHDCVLLHGREMCESFQSLLWTIASCLSLHSNSSCTTPLLLLTGHGRLDSGPRLSELLGYRITFCFCPAVAYSSDATRFHLLHIK